ncbi:MAG: hypothetical protein K0V04_44315 [Deltaproteobacteria bacterium]|nr:hypothetical protein [Deltaproteobacteria bacterium]
MNAPRPARDRVVSLVLLLGVVAMLGVRLHVLDDDFPNPDLAGIVYEAELILDGGRPHVDTVGIKPPGAFVMVAAVIAALGRSLEAVQLAHALWLLLGGLGVWWAARALHDREDEPQLGPRCAAIATAVYLVSAAMFSYNYSSWMTPAHALAVGMAMRGLRRDSSRWQLGAGALALVAFVVIQRAAVLGLLLPALWMWARRRGWPGARPRVFALWILGAAAAVLPWVVWYADALDTLWGALVPVATALDYRAAAGGGSATSLVRGLGLVATVFWFPLSLVVLAAVASRLDAARDDRGLWVPGVAWLLVSVLGTSLGGMRFFLHYLVQYAPAFGLLAGHPALARLGARAMPPVAARGARVLASVLAVAGIAQLVEIGLGKGHRYEAMARRLSGGQTASQAAGAHIRQRSAPDDTIFAWGWTAWRVYYWAQRRSPSRVYRPLGAVTTFNTNTAFDPGRNIEFRDGPLARELIEAFDRHPPRYFVLSPSMVQTFGARPDPLHDFVALRDRLAADYIPEAQFGDLRLFRRRTVAPGTTPPPLHER